MPPEVIYYVAVSADGYIATADGRIDWLTPYETAGEDYGYAAFYASVDAILLGRRTYEQCLGFGTWPYADKPCWVFSQLAIQSSQMGVTVTSQEPREVLASLQARGLRRALVGGGALAGAFPAQGLISHYILSVIPVMLGGGVSLFTPGGGQQALALIDSRIYSNDVVQLRYQAAPAPDYYSPPLS